MQTNKNKGAQIQTSKQQKVKSRRKKTKTQHTPNKVLPVHVNFVLKHDFFKIGPPS